MKLILFQTFQGPSNMVPQGTPLSNQVSCRLMLLENYLIMLTCMVFQLIIRQLQTSAPARDIDSAAKFIGAGAATVGVAGSGKTEQSKIRLIYDAICTNL